MTVQVFDGPYCQCRVFKDRGGDVHIVSDGCPVCNPNTAVDALVRALPFVRNARMWEDAAESLLKPRQVFTHHELDTPEVRDLFRGRYGR